MPNPKPKKIVNLDGRAFVPTQYRATPAPPAPMTSSTTRPRPVPMAAYARPAFSARPQPRARVPASLTGSARGLLPPLAHPAFPNPDTDKAGESGSQE